MALARSSIISRVLLFLSLFTAFSTSRPQEPSTITQCRCFPGDKCWPTAAQLDAFNTTVNGRLITTSPIAAPCYDSTFGSKDEAKCASMRDTYFFPDTHVNDASSPMAPFFMGKPGNICSPFPSVSVGSQECRLGNLVSFSVEAESASDYERTAEFADKHNMRLVIRNTGHDYIGRSVGAGAISIWTHKLNQMSVVDYNSPSYKGRAVKMGAGVKVIEAYHFAAENNLSIVGGNGFTVGLAGGYTQGGGHGPLASKFGMGCDQTLEFQVVTAKGRLMTASQTENSDLYWALSGGGAGTYGAVVSTTVKAHPPVRVAAANMTFGSSTTLPDDLWAGVEAFNGILPGLVDDGGTANYFASSAGFTLNAIYLPERSKKDVDAHVKPVLDKLAQLNVTHTYFSDEYPDFLSAFTALGVPFNVSQFQVGNRLVPRSVIEQNNAGLTAAMRHVADAGGLVSGVSQWVADAVPAAQNSLNPAWRQSLLSVVLGSVYSFEDAGRNLELQDVMTDDWLPEFGKLSPVVGAYANEGDFREPDFKRVFFGDNYERLDGIKRKYDPDDRFYGVTNVGSDRWVQKEDFRLCRV